jgi:hypothetical protein
MCEDKEYEMTELSRMTRVFSLNLMMVMDTPPGFDTLEPSGAWPRYELYLLQDAFKKDVNDPDRVSLGIC